jgi:hypothetical protein
MEEMAKDQLLGTLEMGTNRPRPTQLTLLKTQVIQNCWTLHMIREVFPQLAEAIVEPAVEDLTLS